MDSQADSASTILIVDDSTDNLTVLGELLRSHYRVRAANSGERALKAAHSPPRPDLILLDVMMPVMDGHAVLRQLKAEPATADIPVIFVGVGAVVGIVVSSTLQPDRIRPVSMAMIKSM